MMYVITGPDGAWMGVADHPDEAADFAVRVTKARHEDVTWEEGGKMYSRNIPTGWRIGVAK